MPTVWTWQLNDTFLHFDTLPDCDGRTDGRTDGPTFGRRLRPRFPMRPRGNKMHCAKTAERRTTPDISKCIGQHDYLVCLEMCSLKRKLEGHSVERIYLRQRSSNGSVNKTILKPRLALAAREQQGVSRCCWNNRCFA